jgi:hypothetical protein
MTGLNTDNYLPCHGEGDSPQPSPAYKRGDCFAPFGRSQ